MGQPAARLGDPTAHGGVLSLGCPTVLIGGQPAARMGDMHICPMQTPAVVPIPHVGGPVILGSPMVLIGGQPAARMGDMATCVGPPATILMGCPTVLIGEGGSGSASGGGAGGGGAASAVASAATAQSDNKETSTKHEHWIEFAFTDAAGLPVSGVPYGIKTPDGKESESVLRLDGRVTRDALSKGQCSVQLRGISGAKWSKSTAKVGEKVKATAKTEGFQGGTPATIQIFKRDVVGADVLIEEIETKIQSDKVEVEWICRGPEPAKNDESNHPADSYAYPEYYFEILVKNCKSRAGLLYLEDYVELELKDDQGNPRKNEQYLLYLPNGSVQKGTLDGSGKKKIEKVPAGIYSVRFPKLFGEK